MNSCVCSMSDIVMSAYWYRSGYPEILFLFSIITDRIKILFRTMINDLRIRRKVSLSNFCFILKSLLLISLWLSSNNHALGEIRNGYEKDILCLRSSFNSLVTMLQDNSLSVSKKHKAKRNLDFVIKKLAYYELTEMLLMQFKIISPDLFEEINTIIDKKGRPVIVYVKFIPEDEAEIRAWGVTYINQVETDSDAYRSEYGDNTVSVKIWVVNKALLVLAHELGHVKYLVPHLASYVRYHKENYTENPHFGDVGHNPGDPSGKNAKVYEKRFREEYDVFLECVNERYQNPLLLRETIKKKIAEEARNFIPPLA